MDDLIAKLPELNRSICQRLLAGQTITDIAQELKINRRQVKALACNALLDIALDYDIKVTDKVTDARSKAHSTASPGQGGGGGQWFPPGTFGSPTNSEKVKILSRLSFTQ
ncbi:MAG: hypothetical protein WCI51_02185 [Lentisphaerota bacterium]